MRYAAILLLALLALTVVRADAQELDTGLAQALGAAYVSNPQLLAERQRLREVDEGVPKALSGWRPKVDITAAAGGSAVYDSIDQTHVPEYRVPQQDVLSLKQPLYTGGRVSAEVAQSEALVRAERAALQASEATVLLAAAGAYLDVARDQSIVALNRNQADVLDHSLTATEAAFAAGDVTETDIAQARARLADQRANVAAVEAQLAASDAAFEQQLGEPAGQLSMPQKLPELPEGRAHVLDLVEQSNFDLAQARFAREAGRAGVDIAGAGLLPQISMVLDAERAKETDVQLLHQRDHILEGLLMLQVPLYEGGLVAADTRQAKEAAARMAIQVETVRRAARRQAMTALDALTAALQRVAQQQISIDANTVAARGIARQQSVGARTVLEKLNAQQELLAAQVNLARARHDLELAALQLLAATGKLSAEGLHLMVPIYDPLAHYEATRDRWYGTTPTP